MTTGHQHTIPCRACSGPDPVVSPAACPACLGTGAVDPGPQKVATALQELLQRVVARAPAASLPAPPPGAAPPPRPFSEVADDEEDEG